MKAYLDIETCAGGQVTVVGIYREDRGFRQLVGGQITDVGKPVVLRDDGTYAFVEEQKEKGELPSSW